MAKNKVGRPRAVIDWEVVKKLIKSNLLGTEVADYIGVSAETLYKVCERDLGLKYSSLVVEVKKSEKPLPNKIDRIQEMKVRAKSRYKESKPKTPGVYLVKAEGTQYYKIGKTSISLKHRLGSMQTGCPMDIIPVKFKETSHFHKLEEYLHKESANNHVRGEWFEFTDLEVKEVIKKMDQYGK